MVTTDQFHQLMAELRAIRRGIDLMTAPLREEDERQRAAAHAALEVRRSEAAAGWDALFADRQMTGTLIRNGITPDMAKTATDSELLGLRQFGPVRLAAIRRALG